MRYPIKPNPAIRRQRNYCSMKLFNHNLTAPAEQLAGDETLLDWCESGHGEETLRFWEPRETFVVVGYANKTGTEVNVSACAAKGIPIFRRCSGGGTVLQGPGCLNYALILRITDDGPLRNITSANQFIMERNRAAIEAILSQNQITVSGHTDLAAGGRKFSGNSQRRKKNFLLFHGSFLLNFDLALVAEFLRMPSLQPDYRASRSHDDFLMNLKLPSSQVRAALQKAWDATGEFPNFPAPETQKLAAQKYSTDAWNLKL
jgi:lipoate---protein ligase